MSFVRIRRFALILLVGLSLSFSVYSLLGIFRNWNPDSIGKDEVSKWENRLHPVRQALPVGTQAVGYLGEWDLPGGQTLMTDQLHEFNLTIYALAPVVVRRGGNYAWIVGNFGSTKFEAWLQEAIGRHETKSMGGGIYLIHRVKK